MNRSAFPFLCEAIPTGFGLALRIIYRRCTFCMLITCPALHAGIVMVTTTVDKDDGRAVGAISLREAVKYSPGGTHITFSSSLSGQTIILAGTQITLDKDLSIDATSLPTGLTIDGGPGTNRLFRVEAGRNLTFSGLGLTGGNGGGGAGGAIHNLGTLTLTRCTLADNSAACQSSGAIHNASTLTLTQCTLTGNSSFNGGAISNDGTLTLTQCTLSGNSASFYGGAIANNGILLFSHTILAGNTAPAGPDLFRFNGTITPNGVNLIGNPTDSTLTAGPALLTGAPRLSPLGYFGGPSQTMHPLMGSPAIDAGGNTDPGGTDQRGFPRVVNGDTTSEGAQMDLGAVEAGPLTMVTLAADSLEAGTLRSALTAASPQGTRIGFSPAVFNSSSVTLGGSELPIPSTASIFIDASNLSGPVIISGNNTSRVFNIAAGAVVAMHHLSIKDGKVSETDPFGPDGGGIRSDGHLSLFSCSIVNNHAAISNGSGGGHGGGIYSTGQISLTSCTVSGNTAGSDIIGSTVVGNGGSGGGIYSKGEASLSSCIVSGNKSGDGANGGPGRSSNGGGGGGILSIGRISLTFCQISRNTTGLAGFSIATFNDGSGGSGGGIHCGPQTSMKSCTVSDNTASVGGGNSSLPLGGSGGGIYCSGLLGMTSCTISGNTTSNSIGGGNDGGGGIYGTTGQVHLTCCTVAANTTGLFGFSAGKAVTAGTLILQDSIVADNTSHAVFRDFRDFGYDIGRVTSYAGVNFIGVGAAASATILTGDPLLSPLSDNGGFTPTMALKPGSPAINATIDSTLMIDQRGFPIIGPPDLGAYEADFTPSSPFQITHFARTGPNFFLTFPSAAAVNYLVQQSSDMETWYTMDSVAGTGLPVTVSVGPPSSYEFFRVRR